MSIELSDVLAKQFSDEAIQTFQETNSELVNFCRVKDTTGSQYQFQVLGTATAYERTAIQTPIPVADVSHTPKTATVKNYTVSELTDIFLNNQVGFDERRDLATALASALNRRLEQVIIDALNAATITNTVAKNISGSNDNLNVAMFAEAARLLGSKVPEQDRVLLCHDDGFYHFIQESDVKTIDSNDKKPLVEGMLPYYFGFNIKHIADRTEGGLTLSTNDRTNYAWQRQALGLAINMRPRIEVNYEPSYGAHRVTGYLSAGAVAIQESGIVKITSDES